MCTLVVLNRVVPGYPAIFAANRDEFFERPTAGPGVLDAESGAVGGRDLVAGGTWMGVTPGGFFVGLTNQRMPGGADPDKLSRGAVVMDALRAGARGGVEGARAWLERLPAHRYNPFNLVFGDSETLWAAYGRDAMRFEPVPPGVHVLPNDVLNSTAFPKVERIRGGLGGVDGAGLPTDWMALQGRLEQVLADDTPPAVLPDEPDSTMPDAVRGALHAVRVRLPQYGTRSASLVALTPGRVAHYAFADGAPGDAPFVDCTGLLVGRPRSPLGKSESHFGLDQGGPTTPWLSHGEEVQRRARSKGPSNDPADLVDDPPGEAGR